MNKVYNLDESVVEYFKFKLKGHAYKFRHLTTDERSELDKFDKNEKKIIEYLASFVETDEEGAPEFKDLVGKMITPEWIAFNKMIVTEFGGNG